VVTGAGRGLGRDYARMFAAEGVAVAVVDVDNEAADATAAGIVGDGGRAVALGVDVADESSTLAMAKRVEDEFGRIDILVNNAGIWGDYQRGPLLDVAIDYWDTVMAVNVRGVLLCSRAVVPAMRRQHWGRIVNISSMGAYMVAGVYGVSKLAVNQLTYALASELGDDGITVNAVAPGSIDNEATRRQVPPQGMEALIAKSIIKRPGTSVDLFGMIRYLTSDEAGWVTGQTFLANGGFNTRF
jgi:3-oxoacyl-[acyl-carrier protein] reductase